MVMFLCINASGLTLIPITIMMYRAQLGAANPSDVFLPIMLATFTSTLVAILAVCVRQKINILQRNLILFFGGLGLFIGGLVWLFNSMEQEQVSLYSTLFANTLLFTIICGFIISGMRKKINVYDAFIEGAKEGFQTAITIIPYLVAILVGIGVFRASGAMDFIIQGVRFGIASIGLNTDFVEALPTMLMKPLSADLNCMRQTLLFGGLESIEHNMKRKNGNVRFYEFGNCYDYNIDNKKEDETLAQFSEDYRLGIWVAGNRVENNWAHPDEKSSVYELKAYVENILARLGVDMKRVIFGNLTNDIYSSGLSITTGSGRQLGTMGIVSKKLRKMLDIDMEVYYAELSWTQLMKEIKKAKVTFSEISKFPAVKRDLALLLDKSVQFSEVEKIAKDSDRKLLKEVSLFDVYEGKNLPAGKKSYAVSFFMQDESKTLNDKQIDAIMKKIQTNLEQKLGAQLR